MEEFYALVLLVLSVHLQTTGTDFLLEAQLPMISWISTQTLSIIFVLHCLQFEHRKEKLIGLFHQAMRCETYSGRKLGGCSMGRVNVSSLVDSKPI